MNEQEIDTMDIRELDSEVLPMILDFYCKNTDHSANMSMMRLHERYIEEIAKGDFALDEEYVRTIAKRISKLYNS